MNSAAFDPGVHRVELRGREVATGQPGLVGDHAQPQSGGAQQVDGLPGAGHRDDAAGVTAGTSFIPHCGQVPGAAAVTCGCIGQTYEVAASSPP